MYISFGTQMSTQQYDSSMVVISIYISYEKRRYPNNNHRNRSLKLIKSNDKLHETLCFNFPLKFIKKNLKIMLFFASFRLYLRPQGLFWVVISYFISNSSWSARKVSGDPRAKSNEHFRPRQSSQLPPSILGLEKLPSLRRRREILSVSKHLGYGRLGRLTKTKIIRRYTLVSKSVFKRSVCWPASGSSGHFLHRVL